MTTLASTFYCRPCALRRGLLAGLHPPTTDPSSYQHAKALKHTRPATFSTGYQSVLRSGSTSDYLDLARRAFTYGFLEIEPNGRRSLVYQTTGAIGDRFHRGHPVNPLDSFRWVLSTGRSLAHGRPVSSSQYAAARCADCAVLLTST